MELLTAACYTKELVLTADLEEFVVDGAGRVLLADY